jgi:hypothetical protein
MPCMTPCGASQVMGKSISDGSSSTRRRGAFHIAYPGQTLTRCILARRASRFRSLLENIDLSRFDRRIRVTNIPIALPGCSDAHRETTTRTPWNFRVIPAPRATHIRRATPFWKKMYGIPLHRIARLLRPKPFRQALVHRNCENLHASKAEKETASFEPQRRRSSLRRAGLDACVAHARGP